MFDIVYFGDRVSVVDGEELKEILSSYKDCHIAIHDKRGILIMVHFVSIKSGKLFHTYKEDKEFCVDKLIKGEKQ